MATRNGFYPLGYPLGPTVVGQPLKLMKDYVVFF